MNSVYATHSYRHRGTHCSSNPTCLRFELLHLHWSPRLEPLVLGLYLFQLQNTQFTSIQCASWVWAVSWFSSSTFSFNPLLPKQPVCSVALNHDDHRLKDSSDCSRCSKLILQWHVAYCICVVTCVSAADRLANVSQPLTQDVIKMKCLVTWLD